MTILLKSTYRIRLQLVWLILHAFKDAKVLKKAVQGLKKSCLYLCPRSWLTSNNSRKLNKFRWVIFCHFKNFGQKDFVTLIVFGYTYSGNIQCAGLTSRHIRYQKFEIQWSMQTPTFCHFWICWWTSFPEKLKPLRFEVTDICWGNRGCWK